MNVIYNLRVCEIHMPNHTPGRETKKGWTPAPSHGDLRNCGVCNKEFVALRYHTKYCSPECQKKNNNKVSLEAYYKKKDVLSGKTKRRCKNPDCNIILSRYNKEKYCGPCARKNFITRLVADGHSIQYAEEHWLIN